MRKTMTILILIAFASTLILMMPTQTKAQGPYSKLSIINPGPTSRPTKWSAEAPQPGDIGGANFTFYNGTTNIDSTFFVNITVSNVTQMKTWGTGLIYDNTTLQYVSAWRPTDHVFRPLEDMDTSMVAPAVVVAEYDATHQEIQWGCAYIMPDPPWTFNGTGVLSQIQFKIIAPVNDTQWTTELSFDPAWTAVYFHPSGNEVPNLQSGFVIYKAGIIPEFTTIALLLVLAIASIVIAIAKNRNKRELAT